MIFHMKCVWPKHTMEGKKCKNHLFMLRSHRLPEKEMESKCYIKDNNRSTPYQEGTSLKDSISNQTQHVTTLSNKSQQIMTLSPPQHGSVLANFNFMIQMLYPEISWYLPCQHVYVQCTKRSILHSINANDDKSVS